MMNKADLQCVHQIHGWFQSIIGVQVWWRFDTLGDAADVGRCARALPAFACVNLRLSAIPLAFVFVYD